ncbi:MAG TPA: LytTR family DNA-binding domain-containing protein [Bacillota bacterium]|nr:LytTR family DNA-binding domain-containing protein [Bacillota bacterium]
MIQVGLVDDRTYDLEKIESILRDMEDIQIEFSTTSAEEALHYLKTRSIDIFISDIEMPNLSGYELADFIYTNGLDIQVIFVTAHSVYAVHAFELEVLDYILKPYSKERLTRAIHRYLHAQTRETSNVLMLPFKNDVHMIQKRDILFIERTGRSTTIITTQGEFTTYQSLTELEATLKDRVFLRSHRGFIIQTTHIKRFSLYSRHSYVVYFHHTDKTAMITKDNMQELQMKLL